MSESATQVATGREQRRLETERRIALCALRLADRHGLEGFTMDDLADDAGVSRRTLFNYFPGKLDAILGPAPSLTRGDPEAAQAVTAFAAGGPHGRLIDDVAELGRACLTSKTFEPETVRLRRSVLISSPRLIEAVHERFEHTADAIVELILEREGADFGDDRAHLAVRLLVAIFDASMRSFLAAPDQRQLGDLFVENLHHARHILS